jgi:hypothetical protein
LRNERAYENATGYKKGKTFVGFVLVGEETGRAELWGGLLNIPSPQVPSFASSLVFGKLISAGSEKQLNIPNLTQIITTDAGHLVHDGPVPWGACIISIHTGKPFKMGSPDEWPGTGYKVTSPQRADIPTTNREHNILHLLEGLSRGGAPFVLGLFFSFVYGLQIGPVVQ